MFRTRIFHRAVWIAATLICASTAATQDEPVLHEYFEYTAPADVLAGSGDTTLLPALPRPGLRNRLPGLATGASGGDLVLSPGGTIAAAGAFGADAGGRRNGPDLPEADARFDADTGPEGQLYYHDVFEPSVRPWKRGVARDRVVDTLGELGMTVGDGTESAVSVAGAPPVGFERFVGRVDVLAVAGERIPIPSVAPDMRVHAVSVAPDANAAISRDGADNYFLRLDRSGPHTVTFAVSAPAFYFGGPIRETGAVLSPSRLPPGVASRAAPVLDAAGVVPGMTELQVTSALTRWFRAFEAAPLPVEFRTGDTYADVSLAQRGVCRHRALGFVVTAAAAGLPARYVHNEAHAFVEVHFSGQGWRRVDLGGAAAGLTTSGGIDAVHEPAPDPFGPSGGIEGVGDHAGRRADATSGPGSGDTTSTGAASPITPVAPPGAPTSSAPDVVPTATSGPAPPATGADPQPSGIVPDDSRRAENDRRTPTTLAIAAPARTYRGHELVVRGTLTDASGFGLAHRSVAVVVRREAGGEVELGSTETDARGEFETTVRIPPELAVGRWDLRVLYDGDTSTLPAASR